MTAKEKAKDLVSKFRIEDRNMKSKAKQCALICVDEILNSHIDSVYETYYLEVKQEIIKL